MAIALRPPTSRRGEEIYNSTVVLLVKKLSCAITKSWKWSSEPQHWAAKEALMCGASLFHDLSLEIT